MQDVLNPFGASLCAAQGAMVSDDNLNRYRLSRPLLGIGIGIHWVT